MTMIFPFLKVTKASPEHDIGAIQEILVLPHRPTGGFDDFDLLY